jgi:hypothetical protein
VVTSIVEHSNEAGSAIIVSYAIVTSLPPFSAEA